MSKRSWEDWAKDSAKKGRCPGPYPSFGLPTEHVTEGEYQQSVAGIPMHNGRTCKCWPQEAPPPNRTKEEAASAAAQKRVDEMKSALSTLVDQISLGSVHIEGGKVRYTVKVSDQLFSLVDVLRTAKE